MKLFNWINERWDLILVRGIVNIILVGDGNLVVFLFLVLGILEIEFVFVMVLVIFRIIF